MEKLRKIHCEEVKNGNIDKLNLDEVRELCGFYEPNDDGFWEVTLMFEGSYYTANSQHEAENIANQHQIMALLLKNA